MPDLVPFIERLQLESERFNDLLKEVGDRRSFDLITDAHPWTIKDQITHLAYFDEVATLSIVSKFEFYKHLESMGRDPLALTEYVRNNYSHLSGDDAISWFHEKRLGFITVVSLRELPSRIQWYGPALSPLSLITARTMETWAHGYDIGVALGVFLPETYSLKDVCDLGVRTFRYSFVASNLEVPDETVYVELCFPWGERLTFGPRDSANRVLGPARDFALVVTQRAHYEATALEVNGPIAHLWMSNAQCFAGPPGDRRSRD